MPTQIDYIYSTCTYVQHGVMLDPNQSGTCPTVIVVLSYIYIYVEIERVGIEKKKTLKLKANTKRCNAVRPYGDEPSTAMMLRYLPPSIICFLVCLPIIYIFLYVQMRAGSSVSDLKGVHLLAAIYIYIRSNQNRVIKYCGICKFYQ